MFYVAVGLVMGALLVGVYISIREHEALNMLGFALIAMIPMIFVAIGWGYRMDANNFKQQSAYIEFHESKNPVEDAALTQKKIELNDWLYYAQFNKNTFGIFSLYPEEVLDLEPIQ